MTETLNVDKTKEDIQFILQNTLTSLGNCDDQILRESLINYLNGETPNRAINKSLQDYLKSKSQ